MRLECKICDDFLEQNFEDSYRQIYEKKPTKKELETFIRKRLFHHYCEEHFCDMDREDKKEQCKKIFGKYLVIDKNGNFGVK